MGSARTLEFLLLTRHPGLGLQFKRFTTGGGTFQTGLEHLDAWLKDFQPTLVIFNYGGNDASAGPHGLPEFKTRMEESYERVRKSGARVLFVTPQAADDRKSGLEAAANRTLYAETMLTFGRQKGWSVIDVHHPLELLQRSRQEIDPNFTILRDKIHLTHPSYVAWAYMVYERLDLPFVVCSATLTADGRVLGTENCGVRDVELKEGGLTFTRLDTVLPVLPPGPLPPRYCVPIEGTARYLLKITGLAHGTYDVLCAGRPLGTAEAEELAAGVNLNTLLLDSKQEAPWAPLSFAIWHGQGLDRVGHTRWRFEVRKR
ncbi:MAG: GDSL-type esterase/lipase family protein [Isosphaeraceae bacterium]